MKFDESKVYTALNADDIKVGSKGYFADSLGGLRSQVELGNTELMCLTAVTDDFNMSRFCTGSSAFVFFYLVEEPKEKKLRPYMHTAEMLSDFKDRFDLLSHDDRLPSIWIKNKITGVCNMIIRVADNTATIVSDIDVISFSMESLFESYTYLDGSIIGIEEE